MPLVDGGTVRLAKIVGLSRAMDMILTGRPIKASTALEWGLVNRVVPKDKSTNFYTCTNNFLYCSGNDVICHFIITHIYNNVQYFMVLRV